MTTQRHSWGFPHRFEHKTERQCLTCRIVKVTRHEPDGTREKYWTEFYRGLDKIECAGTPACEVISGESEAA